MKRYPSISRVISAFAPIRAFDKIDGSNIRAEWSRKRGFYKFGARNRLLGEDEPIIGEAIKLIQDKYDESLSRIFRRERLQRAVAFFEFAGEHSAFGQHYEKEPHDTVLIDAAFFKEGIMDPGDFVRTFENVHTAPMLYHGKANSEFVNMVRQRTLDGMTFEGVVCKAMVRRKMVMFKIKSLDWIAKLREYCAGDMKLFEELL